MKLPALAAVTLALALLATPAQAEKLTFDHRLYPPLKAALDTGNPAMIDYNGSNPRYIVDRIAIRGASAKDWQESLLIIARTPADKVRNVAEWVAELRAAADSACPNEVAVLAEEPASITFERKSQACPNEPAPFALYRIVGGKRSLYLVAIQSRQPLGDEARREALAMLASAHLE